MTARLTDEDKQYMLRRHKEGAALRLIGREAGRPDITVKRTLRSLGVEFGEPKTSSKRSSPETEALVVRLYDEGRTWKDIIERSGVTSVTVSKILTRNGRDFGRHESTEGKERAILDLYAAGHSTRDIGILLGQGKSTVNAVIKANGGALRQRPECGNPGYFDVIDTPGKAYWLGFLSADGCMITTARRPEGDHLGVQLAKLDIAHLHKLKETLAASGSVRSYTQPEAPGRKARDFSVLDVYSRQLADSLLALGIGPRKSATVEPWDGPAGLMPHFWRGLFDGDGSLAIKGDRLWTCFLCGSEACVRAFKAWAHEICGTDAEPYFKTGCWYVSIAGRHQVRAMASALYRDAPVSLDRKQERAALIMAGF
jgi:transposase-like protein